ncbi:hypothetical protein FQN54_004931 [Arachnomyces sp. PD_36]|nr:hypothetical protein FQN54_004931 [Arachnomyces sp. PD_36]
MASSTPSYALVTGATGFIGAHVVDNLLKRGLRVRGATRSLQKGGQMKAARPEYASKLDFVQVEDFTNVGGVFDGLLQDINAVIHVASPLTYTITDNEKELILPAINGVKSILSASAQPGSKVQRIVITSSFASVIDINKPTDPTFTYTSSHWNPLTYEESISPNTSPVVAYRGSKKFSELAAWEFVEREKPNFDIVTLCPPMTFGPIVHPVADTSQLNDSNAVLWSIAQGADPLPVARVSAWIDVRDLAEAHVQALLTPEVGGKRYVVASPEPFSYQFAADIMKDEFEWARGVVAKGEDEGARPSASYKLDGGAVTRDMGVEYRAFRESVVDFVRQVKETLVKGE